MFSASVQAVEWHTFTDTKGRQLVAQVVAVYGETAEVKLKRNFSTVTLRFSQLCEADRVYLKNWNEGKREPGEEEDSGEADTAVDKFHPRSKSDIKATMKKISSRKAPAGIDKAQQDAVNELNIYRYLCGVDYDVVADADCIKWAQEAAEICHKNRKIKHDQGAHTDKCNLSAGLPTVAGTVKQYITDAGANNRVARGHRMWCLHPGMGKTGFGKKDKYSAMYVYDGFGRKKPSSGWSYPGKGFFPVDRLHKESWTYFHTEKLPKDLEVEVYKLSNAPDKPYSKNDEIPGNQLPTEFIKVLGARVNFEPKKDTVGRGIYWVRIKGEGFQTGYLVDLY
ncbi:MAG: hypothetical protein H7A51_14140 [Akkermansiaceae bacterium]|nr:hypothetical protein [Akkermansiaceae bacterium]